MYFRLTTKYTEIIKFIVLTLFMLRILHALRDFNQFCNLTAEGTKNTEIIKFIVLAVFMHRVLCVLRGFNQFCILTTGVTKYTGTIKFKDQF